MDLIHTNPERFQAIVNITMKRMREWWRYVDADIERQRIQLTPCEEDRRTLLASIARRKWLSHDNGYHDLDLADFIDLARAVAERAEVELVEVDARAAALEAVTGDW